MISDRTIYYAHAAYGAAFFVGRVILRLSARKVAAPEPASAPVSKEQKTAPLSRVLVAFHILAFAVMYSGIAAVVFDRKPVWAHGQPLVGGALIVSGAILAAWALVHFRSWRLRAKLEEGHQLATGGPFRIVRHPIYLSLNLLALGTAIWLPTAQLWVAFVLMALGGDLRARAEEKILTAAFGATYRDYCARVSRFLPGIY